MASAAGRRLLSTISVTSRPRIRGTLIPNYVRSLPLTPSRWYRHVMDTIAPEVDFQRFFVSMCGKKGDTEFDLIDLYIKTLAKVVGSEREAKKRIYKANCGGEIPIGFGCEIDLETSVKLRELPGVSYITKDTYEDLCYKDYGGEFRFKDGKVFQTFRSRKGTETEREIKEISLPRSSCSVSLSVKKWSKLLPKPLPWLLLPPPAFGGCDVEKRAYHFYSIEQQKEFSINHGFLDYDARFVGSSHGWLALSNPRDNDLFLWNPITGCDIKLPPVDTLPIPEGDGCIRKVIVSCSPATGSSECRVLMIYGPKNQLAFCCPGHSSEWTPIGEVGKSYDDIIYSPSHKLFYCITTDADPFHFHLECWNLRDSSAPLSEEIEYGLPIVKKVEWCDEPMVERHLKYLVLGEQQSNPSLYVVTRHILRHYSPNGYYVQSADQNYPYRTCGFDVIKFDQVDGDMWYTKHSLDGLVMFIGTNHSFAIPAKDFPELRRDCIFFTDENGLVPPDWPNLPFGLPDMDVFNYRYRSFFFNYFKNGDIGLAHHKIDFISDARLFRRRVPPLPMWFTPSLH